MKPRLLTGLPVLAAMPTRARSGVDPTTAQHAPPRGSP